MYIFVCSSRSALLASAGLIREIAKKGKGNIKRNSLDSPYSAMGLGHLNGPGGPFTLGLLLSTSVGGLTMPPLFSVTLSARLKFGN